MKKKTNKIKNLESIYNTLNYLANSGLDYKLYDLILFMNDNKIINLNSKHDSKIFENAISKIDKSIEEKLFNEIYKNIDVNAKLNNLNFNEDKLKELTNSGLSIHIDSIKDKSLIKLSNDGSEFIPYKSLQEFKLLEEKCVKEEKYEDAIKYRDVIHKFD